MNIVIGRRVIASVALLAAVWLGWLVAEGEHIVPAFVAALALLGCVTQLLRVPIGAVLLGTILFGYLVGNRGFAQVMPIPGFPILPAELVLAIAGAWLVVQCAFSHELPFRRDALNLFVLLWLVVGTARAIFDVRQFGFMAVRDFAMVYYALFFFLAQYLAAEPRARKFLLLILVVASVAQPLAALLSTTFPAFFYNTFTFRGVPLILFKGDLALTFMAVSAFILAFAVEGRMRWLALLIATVELLLVIGGDNRASVLGAVAALGWLGFSHARRFVAGQALAITAAFLVVAAFALLTEATWAEKKFHGVTERVHSLTDFFGSGTYVSEESSMKGDNNRFRSVWWQTVVAETLAENPAFGLGFGHDLARNFLREFNPEMADDFTARSPHSIVVSTIGRLGFVGLGVLLLLVIAFAVRTWRAVRDPETPRAMLGLWACAWTIFVSACFGVVLEGPMGAVVFWSLLGVLAAPVTEDRFEEASDEIASPVKKTASAAAASLPSGVAGDEVRAHRIS
jgi:hypothetical protein